MTLTLQPVEVAARHDNEGQLVFADGRLVALLVRLSQLHEDAAGRWFLEVGFEALDYPSAIDFPDLDAALAWIEARLARGEESA